MLVGRNVILRPLRSSDIQTYFDLSADIRMAGPYWPISIACEKGFRARFEKTGLWGNDFSVLLITDCEERPLGYVGFFPGAPYQNVREIGYRLFDPKDQGDGIMTEAVSLTVAYLFASKRIERVQAAVIVGNESSRRVLQKVGFQKEGVLRSVVYVYGRTADMELFSILRHEATPLEDLLAPLGEPAHA
jgi:RimJ/RimL family protein N-acetyltransferase